MEFADKPRPDDYLQIKECTSLKTSAFQRYRQFLSYVCASSGHKLSEQGRYLCSKVFKSYSESNIGL